MGVVENMSDIRVPFASLSDPQSGICLLDAQGEDCTAHMLERFVLLVWFLCLCNFIYYCIFTKPFL